MKKILIFVSMAIFAMGLIACGNNNENNEKTAEAYGAGYGGGAIKCAITVNQDNEIISAGFEEYMSIKSIGDTRHYSNIEINEAHKEGNYAKYIKIGNQMFVFDSNEGAYKNAVYADLTTDEFAKFYIERVADGDFYVCKDELGTESYNIPFNKYGTGATQKDVTKSTFLSKRHNGYNATGSGWTANITLMENAIEEYGLNDYVSPPQGNDEEGWYLGLHNTGATLASYPTYMSVALKAYSAAKSM